MEHPHCLLSSERKEIPCSALWCWEWKRDLRRVRHELHGVINPHIHHPSKLTRNLVVPFCVCCAQGGGDVFFKPTAVGELDPLGKEKVRTETNACANNRPDRAGCSG